MKITVFGLTITSSWGNAHAVAWRGLCNALAAQGHRVVFFERDVPYFAANRDLHRLDDGELVLYPDWSDVAPIARQHASESDVAIITSYFPDALQATRVILESSARIKAFYDLDTVVTLEAAGTSGAAPYVGTRGLRDFDLVLSSAGGAALSALQRRLGARCVVPLYGHVDRRVHRPVEPVERYRCDLSYLGAYAIDAQHVLERYFIEPARLARHRRFVLGGSMYPWSFPWEANIWYLRHIAPPEHPAFFSSSKLTLNITRRAVAELGYCPSPRLFEAAACGRPIVSDWWDGLEQFFVPGKELLVCRTTQDILDAMALGAAELESVGRAARERVMAEHTAERRAAELTRIVEDFVAQRLPTLAEVVPPEPGAQRLRGKLAERN